MQNAESKGDRFNVFSKVSDEAASKGFKLANLKSKFLKK